MSAWQGSTRRARLPRDWPTRVRATKRRANGRCEGLLVNGTVTHVEDCPGVGRECDHHVRGDDHDLSNLRWLSGECHKAKTQNEKPQRLRTQRAHPADPR